MQEKVYKRRMQDVEELRLSILTAWDELDQRVTDTAVRQWVTQSSSCVVKAKVGRHILNANRASSLECCCCLQNSMVCQTFLLHFIDFCPSV